MSVLCARGRGSEGERDAPEPSLTEQLRPRLLASPVLGTEALRKQPSLVSARERRSVSEGEVEGRERSRRERKPDARTLGWPQVRSLTPSYTSISPT